MRGRLWKFQIEDVEKMIEVKKVLNANPMGSGKTIEALAACERLSKMGKKRILIICPATLIDQWDRFIYKYTNNKAVLLNKPKEWRVKQYMAYKLGYMVISYETLVNDLKYIYYIKWDIVVADEAQKIKTYSTDNSKAVKRIRPEYRFALTGTPIENNPSELFSIMQWVNPDVLGPWPRFNEDHIIRDYFNRPVAYTNLCKISEKMQPVLIHRDKDVLGLPPKLFNEHYLEMQGEMRKIYNPMVEQFEELKQELGIKESEDIVEDIMGNKMKSHGYRRKLETKLKVLYLGILMFLSDPRLLALSDSEYLRSFVKGKKLLPSPKLKLLNDIFTGTSEKIVVFTRFEKMANIIYNDYIKKFGNKAVLYTGALDNKAREWSRRSFEENDQYKCFIADDAAHAGVDGLQVANILVHYEPHFNPKVEEQRSDRIHRIGGGGNVLIINLYIKDSLEEGVRYKQAKKLSNARVALGVAYNQRAPVKKIQCQERKNYLELPLEF